MIHLGSPPQHLDPKVPFKQRPHLHLAHREGRLALLLRLILKGHQQDLAPLLHQPAHQRRILATHRGWQGDQRRPVIDQPIAATELRRGKEIPLKDAQAIDLMALIRAHLAHGRGELVFTEELADGKAR